MTDQDIISRLERIESLLLQLTSKKENTAPFLPFMEQAVEEAAVSEGTRENHRNTLRHLRDFRPAMTFADLSPRADCYFLPCPSTAGATPSSADWPSGCTSASTSPSMWVV